MSNPKDVYVNQAYLVVTESAPSTLSFQKLETGISIYEKVGWLINRIDYSTDVRGTNFNSEGDSISFGISVMKNITNVSLSNEAVIDRSVLRRVDIGVPATGIIMQFPFTKDFSGLKGGGILIPPNPLYLFAGGYGLASAMTVEARLFYTVIQLKTEDFWELVEARRMISTQ